MNVLIAVTHLLGTGHLARALTLARAFQDAGHKVEVFSGGIPAAHLERGDVPLVQMPPLRSDGVDFTRLLDETGAPASETLFDDRRDLLVSRLTLFSPDVIITELFPFGRRVLRAEFLALLTAARALPQRPLICASIRDILAPPSKPEKAIKTEAILHENYDAVLVHSDAGIMPLDLSWPVTATLAPLLHYTGFVAPPPVAPHPQQTGSDVVIVSAGGGNVGGDIFACALEAARLSDQRWRFLVGGRHAAKAVTGLRKLVSPNVTVEPARPDFRQLLHHASASVSMCGYNTALDILQSGCPAVFIPFDAGNEVEQSLRAKALAAQPGIEVLPNAELNANALLAAVTNVRNAPRRSALVSGVDGAAKTVEIVVQLHEGMA